MGIFDSISSRRNKTPRTPNTGPAASSGPTPASKQSKESARDDLHVATRASVPQSMSQRAAHIPTERIISAQPFVTADNGYNAGPANYVQSTIDKKQMIDENKAEALQQAAKSQAMSRQQAQSASLRAPGQWPSLPTYLDIPGRDLKSPAYHAIFSHLNFTKGHMSLLDKIFNDCLDEEKVADHKIERRHLDRAARKACEKMNRYLAGKPDIFASTVYIWDASINEVAFRFTYPTSKAERFKWAEQVKSPYWTQIEWDQWNDGKKRLGLT